MIRTRAEILRRENTTGDRIDLESAATSLGNARTWEGLGTYGGDADGTSYSDLVLGVSSQTSFSGAFEYNYTINENSAQWERFQSILGYMDSFHEYRLGADEAAGIISVGVLTAQGVGAAAGAGASYPYAVAGTYPPAGAAMVLVYTTVKLFQAERAPHDLEIVSRDLAGQVDTPAPAETDPGVIGTGYSDYWLPDDAEIDGIFVSVPEGHARILAGDPELEKAIGYVDGISAAIHRSPVCYPNDLTVCIARYLIVPE